MRTRAMNLARMERQAFDLAVIGGGITGAGIALDAVSRGLSVALVEKRDFASGTSSRSTKLIHGGLRYLEQLRFRLVREALRERATLMRLAPHLSEPLGFLVPIYSSDMASPLGNSRLKLGVGLRLYDLLAGRRNIARHRWISRDEALALAPMLEPSGLRGGFLYYDCVTNDTRLVIEVIKEAAARGALVANYAVASALMKTGGMVSGVEVADALSQNELALRARVIVNATGVWSDEVTQLDEKRDRKKLRPSKGVHVVVPPQKLGSQVAVLIPSLGEQRFLFVVPWCSRIVIGTTDTDYSGNLDDPVAGPEEVRQLVESVARYFPSSGLTIEDVISTFAGLRPLVSADGESTAELSRKEEVFESESGLISIIGGKLTTYRRMGERVVDAVARKLERSGVTLPAGAHRSITEQIELAGGTLTDPAAEAARAAAEFDVSLETSRHLVATYGGNYRRVLEITRESEEMKAPLTDSLPNVEAEVVYAARFEMAVTVEDFLSRRTRITLLAPDQGRSCGARVASLMGRELGWTSSETGNATAEFASIRKQ